MPRVVPVFRGHEDWPAIGIGENGGNFAVILKNPTMIASP